MELKREQAAIDAQMAEAKTRTARAELDKQRAEIEGRLAGLEKGIKGPQVNYDQLRQIGVVGGTAGPSAIDIQKKMLAEAQKQGKLSAEMVRLLHEKKGGIF